jgi:hypothetical protein
MLVLLLAAPGAGHAGGPGGLDGSIQVAVGQHFTGKICAPGFFPTLEFRFGLDIGGDLTLRLDLGAGITSIAESDQPSFEGATFMVGNFAPVLLYTPEVSEGFRLNLGGSVGLWFSAMWGDNLLDTMAGTVREYLEVTSVSYAAVAGAEWDLSDGFAVFFELRASLAMAKFGREYNTGGVTALAGVLFRVQSSGP